MRAFRFQMAAGLGLLVVLLLSLAWVSSAEPVRLSAAAPADGSAVQTAPGEVVLTFGGDQGIEAVFLRVAAEGGQEVNRGPARVDGRRVLAPVRITGPGTYLTTYRLTLTGGGEVSGVTAFSVGPPGSAPAAAQEESSPGHEHGFEGPMNVALLALDAVLVVGSLLLVLRRPRRRTPGR
ncbi:methionine-rich copper-binding protein CopC [Kitasatospora gansuensis]|uniref:Methionine-rich copper-binding protein CopC n=1 Tax=Kitasatospora gansuensis TaxID=258050 RepID=A0A7W7S770_9ACTN|nr:copper resistance CopC family protein [Kitasatospora gansuensis]MBB4945170.1 methionine-rich copper-binding protein CopC [Kitasatospora gansuensis]